MGARNCSRVSGVAGWEASDHGGCTTACALPPPQGSPVESDGTEFFDAHEAMPWSPERPTIRSSPVTAVIRNSQLPLWPDPEERMPGPEQDERDGEVVGETKGERASLAHVSADIPPEPEAVPPRRRSSLRSLFPSKASALQSPDWRRIDSFTTAVTATNRQQPSPLPLSQGRDLWGGTGSKLLGALETLGITSGTPKGQIDSRRVTASYGQGESGRSGSPDLIDKSSSTVSGSTVTEEGSDSGEGSDTEGDGSDAQGEQGRAGTKSVGVAAKDVRGGSSLHGSSGPAAVAPSKRNSFLRVLEGARTLRSNREAQLKKMMRIGKRRRSQSAAAAAEAAALVAVATDSISPNLDSGMTSPEGIPSSFGVGTAPLDAPLGDAAAHAPKDKCESCAESRSSPPCRIKSCSYKLRRCKRSGGAEKGGDSNRPPGIHLRHHGRGGGKEKGWRSMHMMQCLRYHEGPVWAIKFNVSGTRIATGGQDRKVIVWNLACTQGASSVESVDEVMDESCSDVSGETPAAAVGRRKKDSIVPGTGGGANDGDGGGAMMSGEAVAVTMRSESAGTDGGTTVGEGRRELVRGMKSMSLASTDDASAGRGSSELGYTRDDHDVESSLAASEVFTSTPVRVFEGHKSDVVDFSWSHSDFLCSASIDHTVMLWHPAREERLGKFTHPDFVTSVHFHPLDDQIFLTGCFDKRLRLWKIPDGRVVDWVQCQDMVSAASFSPDGQLAAAGLYNGRVMFYHTTGLRYYTQIHCRNRHGSKRHGKKVTGLDFVETARLHHAGVGAGHGPGGGTVCLAGTENGVGSTGDAGAVIAAAAAAGVGEDRQQQQQQQQQALGGKADSMSAQYSLLTTTNDSRLRIYDLDNFSMTCKFKGLLNDGIQIKASFSEDGMFVISGSEDGQVYLWNSKQSRQRNRRSGADVGGLMCPNGGNGGIASCAPAPATATATAAAAAAAAGTSCPVAGAAGVAAAAAAAATAPATRVKSRTSSSFSVQSAATPKVATVALFFPPAALEAAFPAAAKGDDSMRPDRSPTADFATDVERKGTKGDCTAPERCRAGSGGTTSTLWPTADDDLHDGAGNDDDAGDVGAIHATRRWPFAGHARLGTAGAGLGLNAKTPSQEQQTADSWITGNAGGRPSLGSTSTATTTTRPSIESSVDSWPQSESAPVTEGAVAFGDTESPPAQGVIRWGREVRKWRSRGGEVKAIISADYGGEIRVYLGFVGN